MRFGRKCIFVKINGARPPINAGEIQLEIAKANLDVNFSKILTDSAEVLDFDVAIVGDGQIFATNKGFIDTISLGDNSLYILNKDLTETLESTDYNQFVFSTYKYDVQDVIDDGKLHKNPYLEDMSTFAEDGGEDYMVGKTAF